MSLFFHKGGKQLRNQALPVAGLSYSSWSNFRNGNEEPAFPAFRPKLVGGVQGTGSWGWWCPAKALRQFWRCFTINHSYSTHLIHHQVAALWSWKNGRNKRSSHALAPESRPKNSIISSSPNNPMMNSHSNTTTTVFIRPNGFFRYEFLSNRFKLFTFLSKQRE